VISKDIELLGLGERRCAFHLDGHGRAVRQVGPEFSLKVMITSWWGFNLFLPTVNFRYFHFWFIAHLSSCGSGVTTIHDLLNLRGKTNLKNKLELVNKALLSYHISTESINIPSMEFFLDR
jgi:hypothetical protein